MKNILIKGLSVVAFCLLAVLLPQTGTVQAAGPVIQDTNTNLARYNPGQQVTIYVDLKNNTGQTITNGTTTLYYKHLDQLLTTQAQTFSLNVGATTTLTYTWTPPATDFQGYAVEAWVRDSSNNILDNLNTAVDVSSIWTKFPRYGFVSTFPSQTTSTSYNIMWQLKNYHIDGMQFYDWQWKQHVPLSGTVANPSATWQDIANRTNYRSTILDLLSASHSYGMMAMNYNLANGAWNGYGQDGSGVDYHWGLYNSNNGTNQDFNSLPAGWAAQDIFVFNPADTNWQNYINGQESLAFQAYPFDGWQVDQLGNRGTKYDWYGSTVDVGASFAPFVNNAKTALNKEIVFNDVGTFGLSTVAKSTVDFNYVECWPGNGQTTYNDLKNVIDSANSYGTKATVLAAYMDTNYANGFSSSNPGYFSAPGVLLTESSIYASGGSHIEIGDNTQMLNTAYFVNHNLIMNSTLQGQLLNYYDFLVAYENLLRGGLTNTTNQVALTGIATSNNATANTVWEFTKTGSGYDVIHLINLLGETSNQWQDLNANYPTPTAKTNVVVKYYYGIGTVNTVAFASPDYQNGKSYDLSFTTGQDGGGNYLTVTVPSLQYWDMLYIKKS